MNRALVVIVAACAAVVPVRRADAYVRSKTDSGLCLWWRQPTGVPVVANTASGPQAGGCGTFPSSSATAVENVIKASLATWGAAKQSGSSSSCTSFQFTYQGSVSSIAVGYSQSAGATNTNLIVFRHGLCDGDSRCGSDLEACADQYGCWPHNTAAEVAANKAKTIAITTTSYIPSTGEIVDADMELFDRPTSGDPGFYFTCLDQPNAYCRTGVPSTSCVLTDLGSIVTHEAGHMLGLDHSPVPTATMYATYVPGNVGLRILDPDDISAVCSAYPAGSAPTTCSGSTPTTPPVQEQPKSSGGCSTAGGGVISMIGVAFALARRRRQDTTTPA